MLNEINELIEFIGIKRKDIELDLQDVKMKEHEYEESNIESPNIILKEIEEKEVEKEEIKDINIDEYKEREIKLIKALSNEYYTTSKSININNEELKVQGLMKPSYISFVEKNCKFTIPPTKKIITILPDFIYNIRFHNKCEGIELTVIAYDENGQKMYTQTTNDNNKRIINLLDGTSSIRLALKINKDLVCKLDDIEVSISSKKKLDYLPFKKYRELGFDIPKYAKEIKIACIFDSFTMQCYEPEVNLIKFTPSNWKAIFEFNKPHILMVESAWKGNDGAWVGKVANNKGSNFKDLLEVISWCRDNDIPTVFWNKEDPVHYEIFIDAAKHFDYIFTTNKECIDRYKKDLKKENVYVLQFAAQPKIHNPVEVLSGRKNKICFAGSYYRHKYQERGIDTENLINASIPYGIDIYDRNYNSGIENYNFPDQFQQYVKGVLVGNEIIKANKGYKVVLNLNTVKDSKTMFARRVFELLASNTAVVSNYSPGIVDMFNKIVVASDEKEVLDNEINMLMTDEKYYEEKRLKGLRKVYMEHTYEDRVIQVGKTVGYKINKYNPCIGIITVVNNEEQLEKIRSMYFNQSYKKGDLVIINRISLLNNKEIEEFIDKIEFDKYDYITYMNPDDYYCKNYLMDMALTSKYSKSDIIGKQCIYEENNGKLNLINKGKEYCLCENLNNSSMMISLESILTLSNREIVSIFLEENKMDNTIMNHLNKYSIDKYNYIKDSKEISMAKKIEI